VPLALEQVITKALATTPDARYPSAEALLDDLGPADASGVVRPFVGRPRHPSRRSLALLAGIGLIAAVGGYVALTGGDARGVSPEITSLAVLPLEDLSGDSGQAHFADGMTDALISNLPRSRL
jgi:hypothetical protein